MLLLSNFSTLNLFSRKTALAIIFITILNDSGNRGNRCIHNFMEMFLVFSNYTHTHMTKLFLHERQ